MADAARATTRHDGANHDRRFAPRRRVTVLVIDDDMDTRDLLAVSLERAGHSVATAAHGLDALATLHSIQPEMILLDMQMPVMTGPEFRQAQRRDPELIKIPTVVMTGSKEEPFLDMGVAETIAKPFRTKALLAIVDRLCAPLAG